MSANVKLMIRDARRRRATTLDLSGQDLSSVPVEIAEIGGLVSLDLSNNQIRELDEGVLGCLRELERLDLSGNRLEDLPESIAGLPKLKELRLVGNPWRAGLKSLEKMGSLAEIRTLLANATRSDDDGLDLLHELGVKSSALAQKSQILKSSHGIQGASETFGSKGVQGTSGVLGTSGALGNSETLGTSGTLGVQSVELARLQRDFREEKRVLSAALEREKKRAEFRFPTELELGSPPLEGSKFLSQGGFAVVEKAILFGTPVAVKRFLSSSGAEAEAEFRAELLALARLRHPGIVALLGFSQNPEKLLVFELITGPSLATALHARPRPAGFRPSAVLGSLARTLAFLHARNMVHADLKPLNILLTPHMEPKIIDFGLSRISGEPSPCKGLTAAYAPPEAFSQARLNDKADVWAFGVILWETLVIRTPFNNLEPTDIKKIVTSGKAPAQLPTAGLPSALEEIVKGCLAFEPSARPSMADVLRMLDKAGDFP